MAALKKKTTPAKTTTRSLDELPSSIGNHPAASIPDAFNRPVNPGGMRFPDPSEFNIPPFGGPIPNPMAGAPLPPPGMMPPMSSVPTATQSADLMASVGNLLKLSVDALSAALAGSTRIMQGFATQGQTSAYGHEYYAPQGFQHGRGHHHSHGHCCGAHQDPACHYPSCCDCYGENCCNPSVHGCC